MKTSLDAKFGILPKELDAFVTDGNLIDSPATLRY